MPGQSAPLVPLTLVGPGFAGLNTQTSSTIMGPEWASEAQNMVFDDSGRPAARKGWASVTTTPISGTPEIVQIFEFQDLTGTKRVITATADDIFNGTTAPSSIIGTLTPAAGNWQFVNYYGKVLGLQYDEDLIYWNGTGNFAAVTAASGTVPDGNCLLSAFGRLWGSSDDGQTLKYCALLDETNWGSTGAGSINFAHIWKGIDIITAIASFNNFIVVFGERHIVLIADDSGSELGLDPTQARVVDVIVGTGCIARDSVQNINGDDLVFLSGSGLQSLKRVIEAEGNPLRDISKNVRDELMAQVNANTLADIRSTYNANEGFYLLSIPGSGYTYCFDTRVTLQDNSWRVTRWTGITPTSMMTRADQLTTYIGNAGEVLSYSGYQDDGASYRWIYNSPWMVVSPEVADRVKLLKRMGAILSIAGAASVIFKWGFDFKSLLYSITKTSAISGVSSDEWGTAEWGEAEWGGGYFAGLNEFEVPGMGSGQFIKVGLECEIDNFSFAVQQLQLFAKVGRLT